MQKLKQMEEYLPSKKGIRIPLQPKRNGISCIIDNRSQAVKQAKLIEVMSSKNNFQNNNVLQRTQRRDNGGTESKEVYKTEIEATDTSKEFEALTKSFSPDSGIFLGDVYTDWRSIFDPDINNIIGLVLPDPNITIAGLLPSQQKNGLSIQQNCSLAARHELIHFKHFHNNLKKGRKGLGAQTLAPEFNGQKLTQNINDLLTEASRLPGDYGSFKVQKKVDAIEYIKERLEYILQVSNQGNNAEAPAVMAELDRYLLFLGIADIEWKQFHTNIQKFNQACKKAL